MWTFAETIAEIARATGRHIRYVEISAAAYASALEDAQLLPELRALILYLSLKCSTVEMHRSLTA